MRDVYIYYYKMEVSGSSYDTNIYDFLILLISLLFWVKYIINKVLICNPKVEKIIFNY